MTNAWSSEINVNNSNFWNGVAHLDVCIWWTTSDKYTQM